MTDTQQPAAPSSSNFQLVFNSALKAFQKRTKKNILGHPLAAQLQACDSPTAILVLLHQQVEELNQSQDSDERLSKWLKPTVNVLYAFSATLGEGVGLVRLVTTRLMFSPSHPFIGIFTWKGDLCRNWRPPSSPYFLHAFVPAIETSKPLRQLETFEQAEILSSTSSSA